METLVKLDRFGDAAIHLTNKLSNAIGWVANMETPRKVAINTYIKEIQEKDYDPLTKAALISNAKKIIKGYCNQRDIVNLAIQNLENTSQPERIEDDWLAKFMDKAKRISSEEFHLIWGKVLARECNVPGSVPISLLYTLDRMDREDAEAFTALCRISVRFGEDCSPVIIASKLDDYKALIGVSFDNLVNLKALGLIEMGLEFGPTPYALTTEKHEQKVFYFDNEYEVHKEEIDIGNVVFTKIGKALCETIEVEKVEGFWEKYCLPFWKENR